MGSLGGRPWGKELKAPVALALVVLAVAAWKVEHSLLFPFFSRNLFCFSFFDHGATLVHPSSETCAVPASCASIANIGR